MDKDTKYFELIQKVSKVDIKAALYMRHEARELESFTRDSMLIEAFAWSETPQGFKYWHAISKELREI